MNLSGDPYCRGNDGHTTFVAMVKTDKHGKNNLTELCLGSATISFGFGLL